MAEERRGDRNLLHTVTECAAELELSERTAWRMIANGRLRATYVGANTFVHEDDLDVERRIRAGRAFLGEFDEGGKA